MARSKAKAGGFDEQAALQEEQEAQRIEAQLEAGQKSPEIAEANIESHTAQAVAVAGEHITSEMQEVDDLLSRKDAQFGKLEISPGQQKEIDEAKTGLQHETGEILNETIKQLKGATTEELVDGALPHIDALARELANRAQPRGFIGIDENLKHEEDLVFGASDKGAEKSPPDFGVDSPGGLVGTNLTGRVGVGGYVERKTFEPAEKIFQNYRHGRINRGPELPYKAETKKALELIEEQKNVRDIIRQRLEESKIEKNTEKKKEIHEEIRDLLTQYKNHAKDFKSFPKPVIEAVKKEITYRSGQRSDIPNYEKGMYESGEKAMQADKAFRRAEGGIVEERMREKNAQEQVIKTWAERAGTDWEKQKNLEALGLGEKKKAPESESRFGGQESPKLEPTVVSEFNPQPERRKTFTEIEDEIKPGTSKISDAEMEELLRQASFEKPSSTLVPEHTRDAIVDQSEIDELLRQASFDEPVIPEVVQQETPTADDQPSGSPEGAPPDRPPRKPEDEPETDIPFARIHVPETDDELQSPRTLEDVANLSEGLNLRRDEIPNKAALTQEEFDKEQRERFLNTNRGRAHYPEDSEEIKAEIESWKNGIPHKEPLTQKKLNEEQTERLLSQERVTEKKFDELEPEYKSGYEGMRARMPRMFHGMIDRAEAKSLSKKVDKEYKDLAQMDAMLKRLNVEYKQLIGADTNPDVERELQGKSSTEIRAVLNEVFKVRLQEINESNLSPKDKETARARLDTDNERSKNQLEKVTKERDEMTWKYENARKAMGSFEGMRDKAVERVKARIDEKLEPRRQALDDIKLQVDIAEQDIEGFTKRIGTYQARLDQLKKQNDPETFRYRNAIKIAINDANNEKNRRLADLDSIKAKAVGFAHEYSDWKVEKRDFDNFTRDKARTYEERESLDQDNTFTERQENLTPEERQEQRRQRREAVQVEQENRRANRQENPSASSSGGSFGYTIRPESKNKKELYQVEKAGNIFARAAGGIWSGVKKLGSAIWYNLLGFKQENKRNKK
jgi:hypothetical protein